MVTIFEEIVTKFETDFPEIKLVDWDKGQMNFERPPIVFPAALIKIQVVESDNLNDTKQLVNAHVIIKLCYDFTGQTHNATPKAVRAESMKYLETSNKVFTKFQGWRGEEFNPLARINCFDEDRPDSYKTNITTFKTAYHESV